MQVKQKTRLLTGFRYYLNPLLTLVKRLFLNNNSGENVIRYFPRGIHTKVRPIFQFIVLGASTLEAITRSFEPCFKRLFGGAGE